MTPSERTMPVIEVIGPRLDKSYVVHLPGGIEVTKRSRDAIEEVVRRHAPGSAIRFVQR